MSKVKFDLNLQGLNELMKSKGMQDILQEKGDMIASRAKSMAQDTDAEYEAVTYPINWIAVTNIKASNGAAVRENLERNTLLKALGGGG